MYSRNGIECRIIDAVSVSSGAVMVTMKMQRRLCDTTDERILT